MPATYEAISSTTLTSATSTITFSSISSAYTDLKLVFVYKGTNGSAGRFTLNNDTSNLYSYMYVTGNGTSLSGTQVSNTSGPVPLTFGTSSPTTTFVTSIIDIVAYRGSTNKTILGTTHMNQGATTGEVNRVAYLYRSTSAITRIDLTRTSGAFDVGTMATLYGILKA